MTRSASWLFLVGSLCLPGNSHGQVGDVQTSTYAAIDRHALLAFPEMEQSVNRLVDYLVKPAESERDKARAIFRWITDRLTYDIDALLTSHPGETRPDMILRSRKATGIGFAVLFEAMAKRAGLEAAIIPGYVKGFAAPEEHRPFRPNHAWNAVKIDGQWQLVDSCLGAGYLRMQRFRKVLQEQFFLPPPQHMVVTHLPADPRWQLLPYPLAPQQWDALPTVDLQLLNLGVTLEAISKQVQTSGNRKLVRVYAQQNAGKVLSAPIGAELVPGQEYYFLIDAPHAANLYLVQKDRWIPLRRNGTRFEAVIRPEPGDLRLNVQRSVSDRTTYTMLVYQVREW